MIVELLPLMDGWRREIKEFRNVKVKAGSEVTLAEGYESGWIVAAGCVLVGSPYSYMKIYFHDRYGNLQKVFVNPSALYGYGITGHAPINGGSVTYFSSDENRYSVAFNPQSPVPFVATKDYPIRFAVEAVDTDTVVEYLGYEVVFVVDKQKFIKSLRDIFGSVPVEVVRW